jgi:hypothetical protein
MLVGNRRFYLNSKTSKKGWSPEDVMEDVDHIIAPSPADYIQQKFNEKTGRLFYINSKTGKKGWAMEDVMDDSGEPVEEDTQPRVAGTVSKEEDELRAEEEAFFKKPFAMKMDWVVDVWDNKSGDWILGSATSYTHDPASGSRIAVEVESEDANFTR